ncbi:Trm112 family protein [Chelativorans sp.]|uniref:Trm112 family protein n=1 Tax=Chelativorans sp. TaxID=2203393 RepID=UPI0028124DAD|nr:Trm112 family protein [Chelativorans sp.]
MAEAGRGERSLVDPKLLELLVCPLTKAPLKRDIGGELVSAQAALAYPVRDGVPVMLPSEARPLDAGKATRS